MSLLSVDLYDNTDPQNPSQVLLVGNLFLDSSNSLVGHGCEGTLTHSNGKTCKVRVFLCYIDQANPNKVQIIGDPVAFSDNFVGEAGIGIPNNPGSGYFNPPTN